MAFGVKHLTTSVPLRPLGPGVAVRRAAPSRPERPLHVGDGVGVGGQKVSEQGDVGDSEAQRVDLGEALFVREGRHVDSQLVEGRVDAAEEEQHLATPDNLGLHTCDQVFTR